MHLNLWPDYFTPYLRGILRFSWMYNVVNILRILQTHHLDVPWYYFSDRSCAAHYKKQDLHFTRPNNEFLNRACLVQLIRLWKLYKRRKSERVIKAVSIPLQIKSGPMWSVYSCVPISPHSFSDSKNFSNSENAALGMKKRHYKTNTNKEHKVDNCLKVAISTNQSPIWPLPKM